MTNKMHAVVEAEEAGEQMLLMDIHTDQAKKILAKVKAYKKVQAVRLTYLAE